MAFERQVEEIIAEAMRAGEFQDLARGGRPIDLGAYFNTPEDVRVAYALLKNAGLKPPEVDLLAEIASLGRAAKEAPDATTRGEIQRKAALLQSELNIRLEQARRLRATRGK